MLNGCGGSTVISRSSEDVCNALSGMGEGEGGLSSAGCDGTWQGRLESDEAGVNSFMISAGDQCTMEIENFIRQGLDYYRCADAGAGDPPSPTCTGYTPQDGYTITGEVGSQTLVNECASGYAGSASATCGNDQPNYTLSGCNPGCDPENNPVVAAAAASGSWRD